MSPLTWKNAAERGLSGRDISVIALMISFPVIGLDLVLRVASGRISAQPYELAGRWLTDSLIMLPLFALGVWAGDWAASVAGLGMARRADLLKRALVITLFAAVAQVPAWFVVNKSDNPVTAQPLVPPQAHDSGDVYWVAPWVIIALVCVCLAPVGVWVARAISRGLTSRVAADRTGTGLARTTLARTTLARTTLARTRVARTRVARTRVARTKATLTQAVLLVPLLAVAVLGAWALHQAAVRAYASQVSYTSAPVTLTRHSPGLSPTLSATPEASRPQSPPVTAAPFAVLYQAAHALQDGLAGQAAGLPVAVIALLWVTRRLDDRNQHQPADTKGGVT